MILRRAKITVVELSALRQMELRPLADAINLLDFSPFKYVSVHAPSQLQEGTEAETVNLLITLAERGLPIVVHPDVISNFALWRKLGRLLFIENMDKRKKTGRTAIELAQAFESLPEASLCFDLGHARQVDPTMSEAVLILERFGDRLGQLHISDVNARSTHDPLTAAAILAFRRISHLIPDHIPVVLESPVSEDRVEIELASSRDALPAKSSKVNSNYLTGSASSG
ncbi:MAG TPA: hypothetical protein VKQ28_06670 [Candidatus Acidoferrum sp.]|nr:hypothetical protein [Candidatus Acidoferrum sp.]